MLFQAGTGRFVSDVVAYSGLCMLSTAAKAKWSQVASYAAGDASGLPCRLPCVVRNSAQQKAKAATKRERREN